MPVYAYVGKTRAGETRRGSVNASNEHAALAKLRTMQILPLKISESTGLMAKELSIPIPRILQPRVKSKDIVIFTRQFATMLNAGLPLVQCLDALASQSQNSTFRKILTDVKETVEGGSTFADALRRHPKQFDELYVNLVQAGEIGGVLDIVLNRLAEYREKMESLKRKIKSAMLYPAIVLSIAASVVVVLLIWVIPVFQHMFEGFGAALPMPTQIVITLSYWMSQYYYYFIGFVFALVFLVRLIYRTRRGRYAIDWTLLNLPVFGDLLRKIAIARFSRTLGTMISSGVPILDGLTICSRTAGNKIIEDAVEDTRTSISEGNTIADPLARSKIFPHMVCQMISVGESTGALDTMLGKVADFYEEEVDTSIERLNSMLEPFLIVFLGIIIGGMVVAMYLPIFEMAGVVR